jgi:hypothetical protein
MGSFNPGRIYGQEDQNLCDSPIRPYMASQEINCNLFANRTVGLSKKKHLDSPGMEKLARELSCQFFIIIS